MAGNVQKFLCCLPRSYEVSVSKSTDWSREKLASNFFVREKRARVDVTESVPDIGDVPRMCLFEVVRRLTSNDLLDI